LAALLCRTGADTARFTLDIGGTSTDIGLILETGQQYATEFNIDFGIPVTIPCVAVRTIGAGGGSIAWVDKGGLLHVGPQSAGAEPGPVAYGRGGSEPTVTDANLVLGRLNPDFFLGGAMKLDLAAARAPMAQLGKTLSLSPEAAALAILRTLDENMANAIRLIAVERGSRSTKFALIAFGGAGPLHARAVAERPGYHTSHRAAASWSLFGIRCGHCGGPGRSRPDLLHRFDPRESRRPGRGPGATARWRARRSTPQRRCSAPRDSEFCGFALFRPKL
jgi:N-methylhydantoinase A/oxoprolinase/acetone carboxylase beta subunit